MSWEAAAIAGAADIASGLIGNQSKGSIRSRDMRRMRRIDNRRWKLEQEKMQYANQLQLEQSRNLPSAQVAGAKAAGLHPLFAMGSGASLQSTSTPSAIIGGDSDYSAANAVASAGQSIARGMMAKQTAEERRAIELGLKLTEAQIAKEYAIASAYASEGARTRQSQLSTAPYPDYGQPRVVSGESLFQADPPPPNMFLRSGIPDVVTDQPDAVISPNRSDPTTTAGEHSGFKTYNFHGGPLRFPINEEGPQETLQDMWNPFVYGPTVRANYFAYGKEGIRRLHRMVGWLPTNDVAIDMIANKLDRTRTGGGW